MYEEVVPGGGQGVAVSLTSGKVQGTEVVCVQGMRGLDSELPSPAYGTVCFLLSLCCAQPQWQLKHLKRALGWGCGCP